jgi:hydroxyacylglutathione hydrolase
VITKLLLRGDMEVNCYLVEHQGRCLVIDPGYEKEKLADYVHKRELDVVGILLTHAHIDHIGALDAFKAPVYLHREELAVLTDNLKNGFVYFNRLMPYDLKVIKIVTIEDGHEFNLGDQVITAIHTPGHTAGSMNYQCGRELFTGDTLFNGSVGRWDFPTGDQKALKASILKLVDTYAEDTIIYPGHGPDSILGHEKRDNPFYVKWKGNPGRN